MSIFDLANIADLNPEKRKILDGFTSTMKDLIREYDRILNFLEKFESQNIEFRENDIKRLKIISSIVTKIRLDFDKYDIHLDNFIKHSSYIEDSKLMLSIIKKISDNIQVVQKNIFILKENEKNLENIENDINKLKYLLSNFKKLKNNYYLQYHEHEILIKENINNFINHIEKNILYLEKTKVYTNDMQNGILNFIKNMNNSLESFQKIISDNKTSENREKIRKKNMDTINKLLNNQYKKDESNKKFQQYLDENKEKKHQIMIKRKELLEDIRKLKKYS
jgi:hypothetical protein